MLSVNRKFKVRRPLAAAVPAALVSVVGLLAFAAAPASAASGDHFACRGSALRVEGLGVLNAEPKVANSASDPCASDSPAPTASLTIPTLLSTGAVSASTTSTVGSGSASAQVANASVVPLALSADAATASASYRCSEGTPTPVSSSDVVNLRIGAATPITTSGPVSIPILGLADVELNKTITTPTSVTQRAVDITILSGAFSGAHIVLGEASAGISGNPCQTGTSGLQPPAIQSGPPTSTTSTSTTFIYVSTNPSATLECSFDGAPFTPCTGTTHFINLSVGTHTFSIREILDGVVGPTHTFTWNVKKLTAPANTARPAIHGIAKASKTVSCSTGRWTNAPTRFTYKWSRDGTPIVGATNHTYKIKTLDEGLSLTCTVTAFNAAGASRPATSRSVNIAVPFVRRCPRATGRLSGRTLGLVRLGMTRAQARRAFTHSSNRGKRFQDFFCLTPIGVRVGYPSNVLLRTLSRSERRRVQGRVVLALTSNAFYAIRRVRPGATVAAAHKALGTGAPFHIGLNFWYLARNGSSTVVLKARHGIVEEIGVADAHLTKGRKAQLRFMKSFS